MEFLSRLAERPAEVLHDRARRGEAAAAVHQFLPFQYLAQAMRETLDVPPGGVPVLPFVVLAAWRVAGLGFTYRIMTRRA